MTIPALLRIFSQTPLLGGATRSARLGGFFLFFLCAFCAFSRPSLSADSTARLKWDVDTGRPAACNLEILRGETLYLEPQYYNYRVITDLSDVTNVLMRYKSADMTNTYYSATGMVLLATNGQVRIFWSPTNEAAATSYDYTIACAASNGRSLRAYGKLTLKTSVDGSATNNPLIYQSGLAAGTVIATNTGAAGQSLLLSSGTPGTLFYGHWATPAGGGDMLASIYDPSNTPKRVLFFDDPSTTNNRIDPIARDIATVASNGVSVLQTNTATAAQGIAGTNAQARVGIVETEGVGYAVAAATANNVLGASYVSGGDQTKALKLWAASNMVAEGAYMDLFSAAAPSYGNTVRWGKRTDSSEELWLTLSGAALFDYGDLHVGDVGSGKTIYLNEVDIGPAQTNARTPTAASLAPFITGQNATNSFVQLGVKIPAATNADYTPVSAIASNITSGPSNLFMNASNLTNWPTQLSPYIIPSFPYLNAYTCSLANGICQSFWPTNTTTLWLPPRSTNKTEFLRLEIYAGANTFTFTNANGVVGTATNNGVVFCDGPYNTNLWKIMNL